MLTKRELKQLQKTNPDLLGRIQTLMQRSDELARREKAEERQRLEEQRERVRQHKRLQQQTHREWTQNERQFKREQKQREKEERKNKPKGLHMELKRKMYSGKFNVYSIKNTRFKSTRNFLERCKAPVLQGLALPKKIHATYVVQFLKDGELLDPHYFKKKIEIWPSKESMEENWNDLIVDYFSEKVFGFEGMGSGLSVAKIISLDLNVYNFLDLGEE